MTLFKTTDPEGQIIILAANTWNHIKKGHPEAAAGGYIFIKKTVENPDYIVEQEDRGNRIYVQNSTSIANYYNVITVSGDVKTTYHSLQMVRGEVVWHKK